MQKKKWIKPVIPWRKDKFFKKLKDHTFEELKTASMNSHQECSNNLVGTINLVCNILPSEAYEYSYSGVPSNT